jgi:nucleotide-binding universal stress UspA family protein
MIYPIRNIVAGISEFEMSDPVLVAALGLAERTGATLHLVCAIDPSSFIVDPYPAIGGSLVELEESRDDVRRQLETQIRALTPKRSPELAIVVGIPGDEILTARRRENADLIVVGATR